MADWVANIAKGKVKFYAELPATNDALIIVLLESTGIEADATLKDYDDLASLLAGSSNEQTTMGRKTITSVTNTVDDTNDRFDSDFADQTWTASAGNQIAKALVCYDPDTTGGTDSSVIPLAGLDFVIIPDGSDVTLQVAAAGWFRSS
jgi:hypothetical protein